MGVISSVIYFAVVLYIVAKVSKAKKKTAQRNTEFAKKQAAYGKKPGKNASGAKIPDALQSILGQTVSDDGHRVPDSQDLTCETRHGHRHPQTGPRYIVHEEPTLGYVVLNGVKRKLTDCKNL